MFQHRLDGEHVGVALTPGKGLHGDVDDVAAVLAHFEDAGHDEAGAVVAVVLHYDLGVLRLNHAAELAQEGGLADAGHVFQADFGGAGLDELVGDGAVIFSRVNGRIGDAERGLGRHTGFERIMNGGDNVAHVVQAAKNAGDVDALSVLHLVLQAAKIGRAGEHAQGIQAAVEHVRLDTGFVEGLRKGADSLVGVLAIKEVHLLKGSAVGLDAGEATHLDDDGGYALQLILARLELTSRLEHVAIDEAELYLSFHIQYVW